MEEERYSYKKYEGWGKIFIKVEDISVYQQKESRIPVFKNVFSLVNLFKTSGFLPYYATHPITFPALVIKENSFKHT